MDEYKYGEHTGPAEVLPRGRDRMDEVANIFGDTVYCRMKGMDIECPFCGRWASTSGSYRLDFTCTSCKHTVALQTRHEHWAGIRLSDLLDVEVPRYYLPRDWGPHRWIWRIDLQGKYAQYKKELSDVC